MCLFSPFIDSGLHLKETLKCVIKSRWNGLWRDTMFGGDFNSWAIKLMKSHLFIIDRINAKNCHASKNSYYLIFINILRRKSSLRSLKSAAQYLTPGLFRETSILRTTFTWLLIVTVYFFG